MMLQADAAALIEQLYCDYRAPLLRRLYQLVGDGDVAEDLLQETFLKVMARLEQALAVEYKAAWLNSIATNTARDHFRRQNRSGPALSVNSDGDSVLDTLQSNCAAEQPGSAEMDQALDIRATLNHLPAHKRTPLILHYCEGYSIKDMASLMATETGTVRSRLFRARELFRQVYKNPVFTPVAETSATKQGAGVHYILTAAVEAGAVAEA